MRAAPTAFIEAVSATGPDRAATVARLEALAHLLDTAFVLPGTRIRVGLDAVIGLVPFVGDAVSACLSSYIVWEARRLGLPRWKVARMIGNVALDTAVGAIPFAGDAFDAMFKSNRRNMKILRDHLAQEAQKGVIDADYTILASGRASDAGAKVVR